MSEESVQTAFEKSIDEGKRRLGRSWAELLATGTVGGFDVGVGVLGLLVVLEATGNELLASLAFSIGFIALTLAKSELFTENFLVPVTTVVAGKSSLRSLLRLWGGTAGMNLIGGWVFTGLLMVGFPDLRHTAVEVATHYAEMGINVKSFAAGVVAGMVITLMTWMVTSTDAVVGKLAAAASAGFLLAAAAMNHAIVLSLVMFAALHAGAPFGYLDWLGAAAWAALANMAGGMGLVTLVRLVQVGRAKVDEERRRPFGGERPDGDETRESGLVVPEGVISRQDGS